MSKLLRGAEYGYLFRIKEQPPPSKELEISVREREFADFRNCLSGREKFDFLKASPPYR
jgi:hypothetical protein